MPSGLALLQRHAEYAVVCVYVCEGGVEGNHAFSVTQALMWSVAE